MNSILQCGHACNAVNANGSPCCVICFDVTPELIEKSTTIMEIQPDLSCRQAKCLSCGKIASSNEDLAFFEYKHNNKFDYYYCGCRGWD